MKTRNGMGIDLVRVMKLGISRFLGGYGICFHDLMGYREGVVTLKPKTLVVSGILGVGSRSATRPY